MATPRKKENDKMALLEVAKGDVDKLRAALDRALGVRRVMEARRDRKRFEDADRQVRKLEGLLRKAEAVVKELERPLGFRSQAKRTPSGKVVRV